MRRSVVKDRGFEVAMIPQLIGSDIRRHVEGSLPDNPPSPARDYIVRDIGL